MADTPLQCLIDRATIDDLQALKAELGDSDQLSRDAIAELVEAARLANAGDSPAAAVRIASVVESLKDPRALFMAFQFYFRTGDLANAEAVTRRRVAISARPEHSASLARALSNLALVLTTRGNLTEAQAAAEQAIVASTAANDERGLARDLGTLAYVHEACNNDAEAERLYLNALSIAERLDAKDLIATKLANLGDIAHRRGDFALARDLWTRALPSLHALGKHDWAVKTQDKLSALPHE